jgi:hypothetical protein
MFLDHYLPDYDVRMAHSINVRSSPEAAIAAAREIRGRDVPLLVALMALRGLPARLLRRRPVRVEGPLLEEFANQGFCLLGEAPDQFALGAVGRFWRADSGIRPVAPGAFADFAEPGYAKAAVALWATPEGDGESVLSTETRIQATDASARRRFRLYWRLIHPGSAAIRRAWLRAVKRRAEAGQATAASRPCSFR